MINTNTKQMENELEQLFHNMAPFAEELNYYTTKVNIVMAFCYFLVMVLS